MKIRLNVKVEILFLLQMRRWFCNGVDRRVIGIEWYRYLTLPIKDVLNNLASQPMACQLRE